MAEANSRNQPRKVSDVHEAVRQLLGTVCAAASTERPASSLP